MLQHATLVSRSGLRAPGVAVNPPASNACRDLLLAPSEQFPQSRFEADTTSPIKVEKLGKCWGIVCGEERIVCSDSRAKPESRTHGEREVSIECVMRCQYYKIYGARLIFCLSAGPLYQSVARLLCFFPAAIGAAGLLCSGDRGVVGFGRTRHQNTLGVTKYVSWWSWYI